MKDIVKIVTTFSIVMGVVMFLIVGTAWTVQSVSRQNIKRSVKPVVVLPNDAGLISKYDGDPSLLSAYTRNDSIFLNFEGY